MSAHVLPIMINNKGKEGERGEREDEERKEGSRNEREGTKKGRERGRKEGRRNEREGIKKGRKGQREREMYQAKKPCRIKHGMGENPMLWLTPLLDRTQVVEGDLFDLFFMLHWPRYLGYV